MQHPPLRRVSRGLAQVSATFDHHPPPILLFANPSLLISSCSSSPLITSSSSPLTSSSSSGMNGLDAHDSCYSSCSEESHCSLSRELSDTLANEQGQLSNVDPGLVEFATKLGYSELQLQLVLDKLGNMVGQDRILAELIKLGKKNNAHGYGHGHGHGHGQITRSNDILNPITPITITPQLRSIVIDGSNIAMTHGHKEIFSCAGIRECVDFFVNRGHTDIKVFVPQFRRETARFDCPITDQHILLELEGEIWTPSRRVNGRRVVCHDDRYILKTAAERDAVIVSNDEYRDLSRESREFKKLVEERLLMYSFVDGKFMPPDDPLGRHGPTLDQFLSKGVMSSVHSNAQLCPYGRKCTYGNKCKFAHPERPNGLHVSVTDRLIMEKSQRPSLMYEQRALRDREHLAIGRTRSLNVPPSTPIQDAWLTVPQQHSIWFQSTNHHHRPLDRNFSAPLHSPCSTSISSMSSSVSDLNGQLFPVDEQWSEGGHMFVPSTAVWGESEYSVAPVSRSMAMEMERSHHLRYNFGQGCPETFTEQMAGISLLQSNDMNNCL